MCLGTYKNAGKSAASAKSFPRQRSLALKMDEKVISLVQAKDKVAIALKDFRDIFIGRDALW